MAGNAAFLRESFRFPFAVTPLHFYPMKAPLICAVVLCLAFFEDTNVAAAPGAPEPVFRSGDRVVFVGNTFVERARLYGEIETALSLAAGPDVSGLTFRNLGWSGDSVFGDARSYFGPPSEGRERLDRAFSEARPQVVFICYGTGAAMSVDQGWTGEATAAERSGAGLEESLALFLDGYRGLIDRIRASSGDDLREIVLLAPPPLENLGNPLPDHADNNRNLARFRDEIRELAASEELRFVDLFAAMGGDDSDGSVADPALTENGIHFGREGYRIVGRRLVEELGYEADAIAHPPELVAAMQNHIVEKNRLFFHRWRPANETYLFLFRKHEQGQNAKEIPLFDPLIEAEETKIEAARLAVFAGKVKK